MKYKIILLGFLVGCGAAPKGATAVDPNLADTQDPQTAKKAEVATPDTQAKAQVQSVAPLSVSAKTAAVSSTPSGLPQGITVLLTGSTMPDCTASNSGQTVYVQDSSSFQYCDSKQTWSTIDLKGAAGAAGSTGDKGATGAVGAQGAKGYGMKSSSRTATVAECTNGGSALDTWVSVSGNNAYTVGTDTNFNTLKTCDGADGSTAVAAKFLQYDTFDQYNANASHCTSFTPPDYVIRTGFYSFKVLNTNYNLINVYYNSSATSPCTAGDYIGSITVGVGSAATATNELQIWDNFSMSLYNTTTASVHFVLTMTALKKQ